MGESTRRMRVETPKRAKSDSYGQTVDDRGRSVAVADAATAGAGSTRRRIVVVRARHGATATRPALDTKRRAR